MKKTRKFQITCYCTAYKFPHRLSSGKCNGTQWCQSVFENFNPICTNCPNKVSSRCQVADGTECIKQCPAVEEFTLREDSEKYPQSLEERMKEKFSKIGYIFDNITKTSWDMY